MIIYLSQNNDKSTDIKCILTNPPKSFQYADASETCFCDLNKTTVTVLKISEDYTEKNVEL